MNQAQRHFVIFMLFQVWARFLSINMMKSSLPKYGFAGSAWLFSLEAHDYLCGNWQIGVCILIIQVSFLNGGKTSAI